MTERQSRPVRAQDGYVEQSLLTIERFMLHCGIHYGLPSPMNVIACCLGEVLHATRPSLPHRYTSPDGSTPSSPILEDSPFIRPPSPISPPSPPSPPKRPSLEALPAFGSVSSSLCQAESILELMRMTANQMRAGTQALIQAIQAIPWTDEPDGDDDAIPPTAVNSDSSEEEQLGMRTL